ncbi:MAG: hypothetical protein M3Z13_07335 [Candidatus Dormibacteraeota bacterium]|nr:hypothetical protein [Candidatus Dormibacteraeota bacterium]
MDPEFFAAAAAGVASLLAVLGLRRRSSTPATASDAVNADATVGTTPGAALASAGAKASRNASAAVASVGHQALTLAAQGVGAAGAAVAKGAGLVVDGGVGLVDSVLPGRSRPEADLSANPPASELTPAPRKTVAKRASAES